MSAMEKRSSVESFPLYSPSDLESSSSPVERGHLSSKKPRPRVKWRLQLTLWIILIISINLFLDVLKGHKQSLINKAPDFIQRYTGLGLNTDLLESFPHSDEFCQICDCSKDPPTNKARSALLTPSTRSRLPQYIRAHILDIQCKHVYATKYAALGLIRHTTEQPSRSFAWDTTRLAFGLPTAFIFTKTSPAGKTGPERAGYMQRHVETFQEYSRVLEAKGEYFDGVSSNARQAIWIIVEDAAEIDEQLVMVLTQAKLNFIYFAFGPTHNWGNAQHNAALSMIHALSSAQTGIVKNGPVVGIDDDAEIHPDLLQIIWKVQKVGIWPMGNLGPTGWEGPTFDENAKISDWPGNNLWRKYPIDNGAFTINSSLLGTHFLPGPTFWPTDVNGGESEFMERIVTSRDELEMICRDCHVAWHNQPLGIPQVDDMTYESGGPSW